MYIKKIQILQGKFWHILRFTKSLKVFLYIQKKNRMYISLVIRQKDESQNDEYKKTKIFP